MYFQAVPKDESVLFDNLTAKLIPCLDGYACVSHLRVRLGQRELSSL